MTDTLKPVIAGLTRLTGIEPQRILVDKGHRGHDYGHSHRLYRSGQKRGVTAAIKKELKRRAVVEPLIGHLKNEGHLGRNYLKGIEGDKINVLLTGRRLQLPPLAQVAEAFFWPCYQHTHESSSTAPVIAAC
jgi:hypothetical protein